MAILYSIIAVGHEDDRVVRNFPPQIETSEWWRQMMSGDLPNWPDSVRSTNWKFINASGNTVTVFWKYFTSLAEAETWCNANRLTDPDLKEVLIAWTTTHGITITDRFQEIPDINPEFAGIFG